MKVPIDPEQLWLGAFIGAQVLIVVFCLIRANAYGERALLLHAAAALLGVLAVQSLLGGWFHPRAVFLMVLAAAGLQLLELVTHAGSLRTPRRLLLATSAVVLPLLALLSLGAAWALSVGIVLWAAAVLVLMARAWPQSQPWMRWMLPGLVALVLASASMDWAHASEDLGPALPFAGLLALWAATVYLATGWRGRIVAQTRARVNARNTVDPLTGLATPLVLVERVHAARNLIERYGHPSVLLLVHIENLGAIADEFGLETAESAVLAAANRVRESLRPGDVAARLTHARLAVLAEGVAPAEAAANVASRILVAGLKEPLPAAPSEFLRFRIVLGAVPLEQVPGKLLLHRMGARLDQELEAPSERRIVTMTHEELLPAA